MTIKTTIDSTKSLRDRKMKKMIEGWKRCFNEEEIISTMRMKTTNRKKRGEMINSDDERIIVDK